MKSFTLKIENNCNANWDAMTEKEQGRFCSLCTKVVVDFTKMTDEQIKFFFKDYQGDVCGRFHNKQLEKKYTLSSYQSSWYIHRFLQYAISGLLTLKLTDAVAVQPSRVQTEIKPGIISDDKSQKLPVRTQRILSGKVITANGEKGLSDVVITIEETGQTFVTKADGKFKIKLPDDYKGETVTLLFSRSYYESASEVVSVNKAEHVTIRMYHEENIKKGKVIKMGKVKPD